MGSGAALCHAPLDFARDERLGCDPLRTFAKRCIKAFTRMQRRVVAVLILLLGAALAAHQTASSAITPQLVERMIVKYGAKRTVNILIKQPSNDPNSDGKFDLVLDGVSSGDPRWLALIAKLEPGLSGHTALAESLPIAVAFALPKNPTGVLRYLASPRWLRTVCGYPMIEPTDKEERTYFKAAIPAVRAVREPNLLRAKRLCLSELMKSQQTP